MEFDSSFIKKNIWKQLWYKRCITIQFLNISKENIFGDNSKVTNKDRLCDVSNHRYTLDDLTWNDYNEPKNS